MSELNPKKENVDLIDRKPLAYTVGVFIILLSIFIGRSFFTDNRRSDDCNARVTQLEKDKQEQAAETKAANDKLVQYLLSEKERERRRDSVINETVGDKAKRIIENSK